MDLSQIQKILRVIRAMRQVGLKTSGHQVAKNIASWSRSTTYRKLDKMKKLGLIKYGSVMYSERDQWLITSLGNETLQEQMELPF